LTDDQGWDDIGLHNPKYVNTPHLDRFIRGGTFFSNFYVTPQCAQTRAALMTGRQYPRTGTMLVHAGALLFAPTLLMILLAPYFCYGVADAARWHYENELHYSSTHTVLQLTAPVGTSSWFLSP
jgi:arylsulfatase A